MISITLKRPFDMTEIKNAHVNMMTSLIMDSILIILLLLIFFTILLCNIPKIRSWGIH